MTTSDSSGKTEYSTGQIGVDEERIIDELIFSQAEGIVDGIRELAQNGIDAPNSTTVEIDVDHEQTIVIDDGQGMDLSDEEIREFLTNLGQSTKIDDEDTIGQFGIGFGQALAVGKVTVHSQDSKVEFDAKNWFRDYRLYEAEETFDGTKVTIEHYEDEVPAEGSSEWSDHLADLRTRFQYMELVKGVEVWLNGERVSNYDPADDLENATVYDSELAYMVLKHESYDWLEVYSAGLKVTDVKGHGLRGYVITKRNLELNTARNSIRSGCEVWPEVEKEIADARAEILADVSDSNLSNPGRAAIIRLVREGHDEFKDREVLKMANGEMTTFEQVEKRDSIMFAGQTDKAAGKLADLGKMVLMQGDSAVSQLREGAKRGQLTLPETKNIQATAAALGIKNGYEILELDEFPSKPLALARILRIKMAAYSPYDLDREIIPGEDKTARAWTKPRPDTLNGDERAAIADSEFDSFVAITETAYTSWASEILVLELWRIIAHEFAHTEDSTGEPSHGSGFARRFRKILDATQPAAVELLEEIRSDGLGATFERYDHGVPDV
mgnify:CR=1 FL=1